MGNTTNNPVHIRSKSRYGRTASEHPPSDAAAQPPAPAPDGVTPFPPAQLRPACRQGPLPAI